MTEELGRRSYHFNWVALDKRVLLVAATSEGVDHGGYIGAVRGNDYDDEAVGVVVSGSAVWRVFYEVYFEPVIGVPSKRLFEKEAYWPERWTISAEKRAPGILQVNPVDKHVLCVAVELPGNEWHAYIGAVSGEDFDEEAAEVVANGSKIPLALAEVVFEDLGKETRNGDLKWRGVKEVERVRAFGAGHE